MCQEYTPAAAASDPGNNKLQDGKAILAPQTQEKQLQRFTREKKSGPMNRWAVQAGKWPFKKRNSC